MSTISIILIAIGLSMDCFAVSIVNGLTINNLNLKKVLIISLTFAIFHIITQLIGWFAGVGIEKYLNGFNKWVAFILLSFIGIKMIYEGIKHKNSSKIKNINTFIIIGQAIATSIDAFAVGVSFKLLNLPILKPVFIIGFTTFIFSIIGLQLGKFFGKKTGKYVEIIGGIILVAIGLKIVVFFSE